MQVLQGHRLTSVLCSVRASGSGNDQHEGSSTLACERQEPNDSVAKKQSQTSAHHTYMNGPQQRRYPGNFSRFQWIWAALLLILLLLLFRSSGPSSVNLPYTDFVKQIQKGNVKEITVKEKQITGTFKTTYKVSADSTKRDTTSYAHFSSVLPSFGDPSLMKMLEENGVTVNAEAGDNSWLGPFLITILPWVLILGYFVYVRKKMQGKGGSGMFGTGGLFSIGKSRAKRYSKSRTDVTFDDVAGLENAKRDLMEIVEYLKEPGKFTALGADVPKGVLLMGPPGTGKTLLSRATAGEAGVPFFSISGSEFIEMFVGVGASRVRDLFENAKKEAPAIIFIDEIDSVGRARGTGLGGGHDEREQTLNQILSEMDGFEKNQSVVVIAATNRPDVLDAALIRPGRFDRHITLELPERNARRRIIEIHTRHVPLAPDVQLDTLAAMTVGFSGADLKNLVNEAALLAGRKQKRQVEAKDFEEARDKILLGPEREEKILDDEKRVVAYHEGGHALLAKLLPDTDPLQKVTIIPRGRALGVTEQVPASDRHNLRRAYLLNRIAVMLGGRAAEQLVFGDITNGAASDLKAATILARRMVCQWGMSEKLGPVMFRLGEEHLFLGRELAQPKDFSDETARIIDEEIHRIVFEMEQKAMETLKSNRAKLDALADALLEQETLDNEQVDHILNTDSQESKTLVETVNDA
jgi:cell division protease FtsH